MKSKGSSKENLKNKVESATSESENQAPGKSLPDWGRLYAESNVEDMPWYLPELDPDLSEALTEYGINSGTFLDLGTGPGTQAIELSKRGFEVTGSDIAEGAIVKARKLNDTVNFVQDNILNSTLKNQFDYILDRGCFHIIDESKRSVYVSQVVALLRTEGWLFLKCFSDKNLNTGFGPHHISREQINEIFSEHFNILQIIDSIYHNSTNINHSATGQENQTLFVVMRKK